MSNQQIALSLDVGASLPNPHTDPQGRLRTYESGGSLKFRAFDIATGETVLDYTAGQEFRREVAEQKPTAWFERAAREIIRVLETQGIPLASVTHLVNGFPAFIANNTASHVVNLRYQEGGEWRHWTDVDLGALWRDSLRPYLPNLQNILVVNDLVLGLGAYLLARRGSFRAGDHVLYVMPGGGLGVAEVLSLGSELLLMGTEQGHNFYVPLQPLPGQEHEPERLEGGFASSTAFERNYELLTGQHLSFFEVVQAARSGDANALLLVERLVEGLAYLTSHAVNRGVNRIVLTGNVIRIVDDAFSVDGTSFVQEGILAHFQKIARMDLFERNNVQFDHFDVSDNTLGGLALIHAHQVSPHKGGLLLLPADAL